tara:strand:- start:11929 stop:12279 length:351 start_codon:yes stop_codon:yes gene_type:complete
MGTWHIDKDRLKKILTKPIKNKESIKKLSDGLGDDAFFDFLGVMQDKHSPNLIINKAVIDWLTTPDHNDEIWLTPKDGEEIVTNKVVDKYGKPDTCPSLLENIKNKVDDIIKKNTN